MCVYSHIQEKGAMDGPCHISTDHESVIASYHGSYDSCVHGGRAFIAFYIVDAAKRFLNFRRSSRVSVVKLYIHTTKHMYICIIYTYVYTYIEREKNLDGTPKCIARTIFFSRKGCFQENFYNSRPEQ